MRAPSRASTNVALRQTLFLLLLVPIHRYIAELMPLWLVLLLYIPPFLILPTAGRRGGAGRGIRRAGAWKMLGAGMLLSGSAAAALGAFWIAAVLLRAGGWWEDRLLSAGTELLPATVLASFFLLWEIWYHTTRIGRMLFVPGAALAVTALFWSQAEFRTELFGHPSWYAVYAVLVVVTLVAHQGTVAPPSAAGTRGGNAPATGTGQDTAGEGLGRSRRRRALIRTVSGLLLVLVLLSTLGFVYRGWQNRAVTAGGGLLQPTLFRFDFSDYISLEPEIRLSRDLVFLYREDRAPPDRLLRRYVLSGYSPRRGFYRLDGTDEPGGSPPLSVRSAATSGIEPFTMGRGLPVSQEYYIVNLDPDALIAINEPHEVQSLAPGTRSSFNSAYRVLSRHPGEDVTRLLSADWPVDLPPAWRDVYLAGPVPAPVAALARDVAADAESYFGTVLAVLTHLHEEYYYSLSPGEALNGNQIEHFLFESRKGYCSYFAFSMTLMLRSLGVPSRVAVGFFIDPASSMLGFYPIRGDMAHAWVEVWFDGIGWIEFDPTSTTVAPGEAINTDYQMDQERLSALIQEILAGDGGQPEGIPGADISVDPVSRRRRTVISVLLGSVVLIGGGVGWFSRRRRRWRRLRTGSPRRALLLLAVRARRLTRDRLHGRLRAEAPSGEVVFGGAAERAVERAVERARFAREVSLAELCTFEAEYERLTSVQRSRLRRWWYRVIPPVVGRRGDDDPPRKGRSRRGGGAPTATVLIFVAGLLASGAPRGIVEAQLPPDGPSTIEADEPIDSADAADADELLEDVRRAMDGENYELSVRLLREGRLLHPDDYRFPLLQGDLYFGETLFDLATTAYRDALAAGAPDYATRYMLSRAFSRLNRNDEAADLLEMLYRQDGEDLAVIGDLGWLYFKMHRLEEARDLLERAIAELGTDRDLLMTLATVYSGLWDYDAARQQYELAIEDGQRADDRVFLSVAYYNLSILNANFYRYAAALAAAERSLEISERPSGYMIRAELRELQLSDAEAATDFSRAAVLDQTTPLAHLSLAALWIRQGYPERALARLDRVTGEDTGNWIYNYGTDPDRYQRQVYGLYADAWEAHAHLTRLQRPGRFVERTLRWGKVAHARLRAWYYRGLERRRRRQIADAYAAEDRDLLASWNRMVAAEPWPRVALRYAEEAAEIETAFNPEAAVDYRLFAAGVTADTAELRTLAAGMESPWRNRDRAGTLRMVYRFAPRDEVGLEAAARAWALAPGTFLVSGLRVPVALTSNTTLGVREAESAATGRSLTVRRQRRILRRMGFRLDERSPLGLELTWMEESLSYRVVDRRLEAQLRHGTVRFGGDPVVALEELATELTRTPLAESGAAAER